MHFAAPAARAAPIVLGALGGAFQWLFSYRDRTSVTVKDAAAPADQPNEALARSAGAASPRSTGLSDTLPPWRVIRSRRANHVWTPEEAARRPPCRTEWRNLFLAGGYVEGPLPDGVESAVRSGEAAARAWLESGG